MKNNTQVNRDILILSNGPGEVTTWVRPVVKALRKVFPEKQVRISVMLSPCPHSTGQEVEILSSYPEVDRVQGAEDFFRFLLFGKTKQNWQWCDSPPETLRERGVVLFLGGDQIFPVLIGKRLGYKTIIYAEWQALWYSWVDHFALMKPQIISNIPPKYRYKCQVVGDLMADIEKQHPIEINTNTELIGLLPGSKPAKLAQGVPLSLAVAEYIHQKRPQTKFIILVAPTLKLDTLAKYANLKENPVIKKVGNVTAELVIPKQEEQNPFFLTSGGVKVDLITQFPAYEKLSQCSFCLTTIGANTAELTSLAIPMMVIIPTNQIDAMRAWDGLPGILANLPVVGTAFAKTINWLAWQWFQQKRALYAWPNIWAGEEIVPELVGHLTPEYLGEYCLDWLRNPEQINQVGEKLNQVRGERGAAEKIAKLVKEILN